MTINKPVKLGSAPEVAATPKGKRVRGVRLTPEVLGFTMVRVISSRGKVRMEKRWLPGREPK